MENGKEREPILRRTNDVLQYFLIAGISFLFLISWQAYEKAKEAANDAEKNQQAMQAVVELIELRLEVLGDVVEPLMLRVTTGGFNAEQGNALTTRVANVETSMTELQLSIIESLIELLEPRHTLDGINPIKTYIEPVSASTEEGMR